MIKTRIFRSPSAPYLKDELLEEDEFYPDDLLCNLRYHGFNGIWLRGVLRDLAPSTIFPEFGRQAARRLGKLNRLIKRCAGFGIGAYLYLNEPLCFAADDPFWQRHPHVRGELGSSVMDNLSLTHAMCTSAQATKDFLYESSARLFRQAPGLKGAFLITASEHHTHCYSHVNLRLQEGHADKAIEIRCPRCSRRTPADVITEIVALIAEGARSVNPQIEIIAWNWSWSMYEEDPQANIIANLPAGITLMIDLERGGRKRIWIREAVEKEVDIDEYSLGYVGPSGRFRDSLTEARKRGIKCYARTQLGTTLEIATVPNLPLIPNIYRKFVSLTDSEVEGVLAGWNFGNYLTVSTFAVSKLCGERRPADEQSFMEELAREYFAICDPQKVSRAWRAFCEAFDYYPFSIPFLYQGPISYGPVYHWRDDFRNKPMELWTACYFRGVRPEGDRLEDSLGPFSLGEVIALLGRMVGIWKDGVDLLRQGLKGGDIHSVEELSTAGMIYHMLCSAYNIFRFHEWRRRCGGDREGRYGMIGRSIVDDEIENLCGALERVKRDSRLGFYAEIQSRIYDVEGVAESIKRLHLLRDKL